jgi:hypothetical protein
VGTSDQYLVVNTHDHGRDRKCEQHLAAAGPPVITVRIAHVEPGPRQPAGIGPLTEQSVFGDPDNNITPVPDTSDWTRHEITARVPGDTDGVVLGIFLAARGQIELRNPELIRRD